MDQDDYLDIEPWPVAELAGQAITHLTIGRRGMIEADRDTDIFERETDRFELEAWSRMELTAWMTEAQFRMLEAPIGQLGEEQLEDSQDALLVGSTIAWAMWIGKADRLPILAQGNEEIEALAWAPTPWTPVRSVLRGLRVRPEELLATERERWELLHWRSQLFGMDEDFEEDSAALREAVDESGKLGVLATVGGDFALDTGEAFSSLSEANLVGVQSAAEIRLRTLNWVCGFGESPSSAPIYVDED